VNGWIYHLVSNVLEKHTAFRFQTEDVNNFDML